MIRKTLYYSKYIGLLFTIISICFLSAFFIRRNFERQKQLQILAEFEAKTKNVLLAADHEYTGGGYSDYTIINGQTLAVLRLDRLGIKVSVAEGTNKDILRLSAGHFPESALPGEGNFSIAGHSSLVYTCLFNNLHDAIIGDTIIVTTKHAKHQYIVSDIMIIEPTDTEVIDDTNESIITIVTCTNSGKERLIIRGIEI